MTSSPRPTHVYSRTYSQTFLSCSWTCRCETTDVDISMSVLRLSGKYLRLLIWDADRRSDLGRRVPGSAKREGRHARCDMSCYRPCQEFRARFGSPRRHPQCRLLSSARRKQCVHSGDCLMRRATRSRMHISIHESEPAFVHIQLQLFADTVFQQPWPVVTCARLLCSSWYWLSCSRKRWLRHYLYPPL